MWIFQPEFSILDFFWVQNFWALKISKNEILGPKKSKIEKFGLKISQKLKIWAQKFTKLGKLCNFQSSVFSEFGPTVHWEKIQFWHQIAENNTEFQLKNSKKLKILLQKFAKIKNFSSKIQKNWKFQLKNSKKFKIKQFLAGKIWKSRILGFAKIFKKCNFGREILKMDKNWRKIDEKLTKNWRKMDQNWPKIDQKQSKTSLKQSIFVNFWRFLARILAPKR